MDKKTKMWVGVAVVAAAAYYFWNKSQTPAAATTTTKTFASASGEKIFASAEGCAPGYTASQTAGSGTICVSKDYSYKPYPGFKPPARFTAFADTESTGQAKH